MNDCEKLEQTVNGFCEYISSLPDENKAEATWGPKEVLAHLVQFHENFVDQAEALLADKEFGNLQGRFDQVNAQAVDSSRGVMVEKLTQRFKVADKRLRHFALSCDAEKLQVKLKADSKPQSLASVITMVEHHIRSHHRKLLRGETFVSHADQLAQTIQQFCDFFGALCEEVLVEHEAHFRPILCPIVFWHENAVAQAEAILYSEPSKVPAGRLSDINAAAIQSNHNVPITTLTARLKIANQKLQDVAELYDPDDLTLVVRKNGKPLTFTRLMDRLETDIRRRLIDLKKFVKESAMLKG
ncbi:MAG: hypothetical protein AAF702_46330 [Chloroflexota bacterium]